MKLAALRQHPRLLLVTNDYRQVLPLETETATGKLFILLRGSQTFADFGTEQIIINEHVARSIELGPDGVPILQF
jgi:hypothetical protein